MTLSTLEKQIERIEAKVKAQPGGGVSLWLAGLLQSPEENEIILNAASFLMLEDVLDTPEPHLWAKLAERMNSDCTTWPDARLCFIGARQELESELFDDDEGKDDLCWLARIYYEVFHVLAPQPGDKRLRARREEEINRVFIRPLLAHACPEIDAYSTATHKVWLQKLLDAPQNPESDLASLREYIQQIQEEAGT
jgi:hypothetical protein